MLASVVAIVCSLVALSNACCSPQQWEGIADAHGGYAGYFFRGMVEERTFLAYDAVNQRTASLSSTKKGDKSFKTKTIRTYGAKSGREYVIDELANTCEVKTIFGPFPTSCIPSGAKDFGSFYLGQKGGLKTEFYRVINPAALDALRYTAVQITEPNVCIPIVEQVIGKNKEDFDVLNTIVYADIVTKITNESFFNPPAFCNEVAFDSYLPRDLKREEYTFYF